MWRKYNKTIEPSPCLLSGEYFDTETGLIYLRARYYDTSAGRFISEDPIKDGFNWYVYCGNNPVNFWDPSGMYYTEKDDDGRVYAVIESGDTLSGIAYSEVGDANAYTKMNYEGDPDIIKVGQKIEITNIYKDEYLKGKSDKNSLVSAELRPYYSQTKPIITFRANFGTGLSFNFNIAGVGFELGGKRYYDMTTAFTDVPTENLQLSAEVGLTDNLKLGVSYTGTIDATTREHLKNEGYAGIKIGENIYGFGEMPENDLVLGGGIGGYFVVGGEFEINVNFSEIKRRYFD